MIESKEQKNKCKVLHTFDVVDGVTQYLNFWQALVRIRTGSSLKLFEGLIDTAKSSSFTHGGCFASINSHCFPFASFASPQ